MIVEKSMPRRIKAAAKVIPIRVWLKVLPVRREGVAVSLVGGMSASPPSLKGFAIQPGLRIYRR